MNAEPLCDIKCHCAFYCVHCIVTFDPRIYFSLLSDAILTTYSLNYIEQQQFLPCACAHGRVVLAWILTALVEACQSG
jgi:hypothetical protein